LFVANIHVFKCLQTTLKFSMFDSIFRCVYCGVLAIISFTHPKEPKRFALYVLCLFIIINLMSLCYTYHELTTFYAWVFLIFCWAMSKTSCHMSMEPECRASIWSLKRTLPQNKESSSNSPTPMDECWMIKYGWKMWHIHLMHSWNFQHMGWIWIYIFERH
jgi:hypothetical protein